MAFDIRQVRDDLQVLNYKGVFNLLGWNKPQQPEVVQQQIKETTYTRRQIAELGGVVVFEVAIPGNKNERKIPDARTRMAIYQDIEKTYHENLLFFVDTLDEKQRSLSMWYWVKREQGKLIPREHTFIKGQPGDLALGKLEYMVFDISEFEDEEAPDVVEVSKRLKTALDVERVTRKFFDEYKAVHGRFLTYIKGIDDERDQRWYASVLLNRLMFIYFLQRKKFVNNGDQEYLQHKLAECQAEQPNSYYNTFLNLLFFEGFAKPEEERSPEAKRLLGKVVYLNGGLFLQHPIEKRWPGITIEDKAFEDILALFQSYTWHLDDTPGGNDNEISPHVLGYIFEKYINQKAFGAYYTRPEITGYLCERTIHKLILEKINRTGIEGYTSDRHFETIEELLINLDARVCRDLLEELPKISILDPACGSGAFLVSALNTLTTVYRAITGKIEYLTDPYLKNWLLDARTKHRSLSYYIKRKIITENLFGVDLMEEATEIAKLRLFLALVSSATEVDELEPLPNIDFNILPGNSLVGLLNVNAETYNKQAAQLSLFSKSFEELVAEKNRLIQQYRDASTYTKDLRDLRDKIQAQRDEAQQTLNRLLLQDFQELGVKYEEATWDASKGKEGKTVKRKLTIQDIEGLHPFHWGYEFDHVMNQRGGFDIIIANPPWETFKPQAKEFFNLHSKLISKNKMRIEDFEKEKEKLLQDAEIREEWLKYQNNFPFQSAYFRAAPQYANQISVVDGKKQGTDINLYKLFTEQCYNLLRTEGECGIVIPSGIYTDLGAKQLREMLFHETTVTGLFGFENNKLIFEGVHRSFKFVVLTFEKEDRTEHFPTAFMRHDARELVRFPRVGALDISVELIRRLSPSSLSIMEFKSEVDVQIAQKMLQYPLLGEKIINKWNVTFTREFDITNDSGLFVHKKQNGGGLQPLYEGKMIHQFTNKLSSPRYYIGEKGKNALLEQEVRRVELALDSISTDVIKNTSLARKDRVNTLLQKYGKNPVTRNNVRIHAEYPRLIFRKIARNTDERTLIATILPPKAFVSDSINYLVPISFHVSELLLKTVSDTRGLYFPTLPLNILMYLCGTFNSFTLDYLLRFKVTANVNIFYVYQLPVPRLTADDPRCIAIASRVAKLVCVGPEFDNLRQNLLGDVNALVAIDEEERRRLRSEIDGLVAHLYGLTEEEFAHVLSTFPLVKQEIKDAALEAYRAFALKPDDLQAKNMIDGGENERVEFKVAACWNAYKKAKDNDMKNNVVREVAAFMNKDGGTVILGVKDNGEIAGLAEDYVAANGQKRNRDGYELFLRDTLRADLGGELTPYYTISFHPLEGKEVCCIQVKPAPKPVYVDGELYVRNGNMAVKMKPEEAYNYIRDHWKN